MLFLYIYYYSEYIVQKCYNEIISYNIIKYNIEENFYVLLTVCIKSTFFIPENSQCVHT